nr:hypothetical protein [Tanacetum cinerariifolium]
MEVDIEEDENEPELTYPYEEVDPLNLSPPASESELEGVTEVENTIKQEDETVPTSVYEVGESSIAPFLREDSDGLFPGLMRMDNKRKAKDEYYGKLILELGNEVRSSVEQVMVTMEKLVKRLGNVEEKAECKKLKTELEEARIMPPKSAPLIQAAICRIIRESADAAIAAKRARHANDGNDARGYAPVIGQDVAPVIRECTFVGFMKCNPTAFHEGKKVKFAAATLQGPALTWFNELALICPRMDKPDRVKVDAYIRRLIDNIKGEVTSSKPANLNKAMCMPHKLMEQNSQARDEIILEGKKRKWKNYQSRNGSGKSDHKDNSRQTVQNNQKQGNARAMIFAPTDGKVSSGSLPLCERCFTHHVKQEEVKEVRGRAYAIKDVEPQGPNVVTSTFLLNNRYNFVLFNLGSDRGFLDTRFSSMLNINPIKIKASYEVELTDGRVVSTNTVLRGCTLNLLNHIFEIDLMPIDLGTFDIIIDIDWLVKHDIVIVCGEKVVRIPYEDMMLIFKSNKGVSRLKVISCIKSRLPPSRPVEFRNDLAPRAAPVARAPYRLAPSEMRELDKERNNQTKTPRFYCGSATKHLFALLHFLMDVVFDRAFGGVRDEEVFVREGVVVISSSLDMLTNSYLGRIMVSLIFLEGLDEEALVEFMVEWCKEDEDDDRNKEDDLFN